MFRTPAPRPGRSASRRGFLRLSLLPVAAALVLGTALWTRLMLGGAAPRAMPTVVREADEQEAEAFPGEVTNSLDMKLVAIQPGTFVMGSNYFGRPGPRDERPARPVTLTRPFQIGRHEV